jgi:NAD(P)-dependent dehydrogenase (short-subunit alcohol dehydrogenase family)
MSDNVVLVTGALSGIGRATALAFARAGNRVVISGRRDDAGAALLAELRGVGIGVDAEYVRADVSNEDSVRTMVRAVVARFGRLDVAVNNAGTEGPLGPVVDQDQASYAATFDTNVLGTLLGMKHELRVMQPQGSGSIINLSSTFGHRGGANASLYAASKHAVEGLTKSAALEAAAYGVRVNAVAPGPIDTELLKRFTGSEERRAQFAAGVPLKRLGNVEDIADVIVFLASDGARYLTGQIIDVNGGKTAA